MQRTGLSPTCQVRSGAESPGLGHLRLSPSCPLYPAPLWLDLMNVFTGSLVPFPGPASPAVV